MRRLLVLLFLLLPLPAAAEPLDDVKESFLAYKVAILEADGEAAASVVTQNSRDYFRNLANHALTLDRAGLHEIHLTDRLYAMLLRHNLDRTQLQQMSGDQIVSYAVDHGWIGRSGASQLRLGHYQIEGDRASGTILRPDGLKSAFKMEFVREGGKWLLDLVALMDLTRTAFEYSVQQSGLGEDEFVLLMLEQGTGVKPGPEIWDPPS
ncbi:hypothetical protein AAFN88_14630 [Pelagibius sp. CAU 1746]|uniref:hypothetical protein n=1 Tax=Pelagibius sp. CAU 1746 TaxID=3140370 RepID=UPI00325B8ECF